MASNSYPRAGYNGGAVTDLEYERLVAQQAPDGLIGSPTDSALVYADGTGTRVAKVRANRRALVRGFEYDSGTSDILLSLAANTSGATRIDLIVLRLDRATWKVTEAIVQGTPGSGAPSPTNNTGSIGYWELPVAQVSVANGASTLASGTVTPVAWYIGDDGQILCTSSTRPFHSRGRRIWETNTNTSWVSDGTIWRLEYEDTNPTTVALAAGWAASNNVLQRRNDWAFCALSLQRTGAAIAVGAAAVTAATIPAGYRPAYLFDSVGITPYNNGIVTVTINIDGTLTIKPWGGLDTNRFVNVAAMAWPVA